MNARSPFRTLTLLGLLAGLQALPRAVLAHGDDSHCMWGGMAEGVWGGALWMWIWVPALLILFVVALFIVSAQSAKGSKGTKGTDPLATAKARLARGEITSEEFDQIRDRLSREK